MKYRKMWTVLYGCSALILGACTTSDSANVYRKQDMQTVAAVELGVVESVRLVRMETSTGVGGATGAAVGAVAAAGNIGQGTGSLVAGIVAGLVGGIVGNKIEQAVTGKQAYEIIVKLKSGKLLAVTQETDITFKPGQSVHIMNNGSTARVVPAS